MSGEADTPIGKVHHATRPALPKRFYQDAAVQPLPDGFGVVLDGRPIRTPLRRLLEVRERVVAEAIVEEWRRQSGVIDPSTMPLTRLVNTALDGVAGQEEAVRADIVGYAGSDLVCYRAMQPEALVRRQQDGWDPILAWARDHLGAQLRLVGGIVHVAQPPAALARVAVALEPLSVLGLAALHSATTLTGSALLALASLHGRIAGAEAWRLAHIDEDFQIEHWGADREAMQARDAKWAQMQAALVVLAATRP